MTVFCRRPPSWLVLRRPSSPYRLRSIRPVCSARQIRQPPYRARPPPPSPSPTPRHLTSTTITAATTIPANTATSQVVAKLFQTTKQQRRPPTVQSLSTSSSNSFFGQTSILYIFQTSKLSASQLFFFGKIFILVIWMISFFDCCFVKMFLDSAVFFLICFIF